MRIVLATALLALAAAPTFAAPLQPAAKIPALSPADADRDGVVSRDEAADWLARGQGSIVPIRSDRAVRAQAAPDRWTMFDQGLLRPNDFRAPPPEQRPAEDLFYKDFKKPKK
uniref:EF-hand domain-containing protein n=1 Tax=Caulobacter sp. (strain K31) TaxID=366602 RepID=B0T1R7_CAUSK